MSTAGHARALARCPSSGEAVKSWSQRQPRKPRSQPQAGSAEIQAQI